MKRAMLFPAAMVLVLLVSGCAQTGCPECPSPGTYSSCNEQAMKARTNYRCDKSTDYQCESFEELKECSTEITLAGTVEATVSPSVEERVEGIIKVEVKSVPADTIIVAYYLDGGDLPSIGDERRPFFATDQGDVWSGMIDTSDYANGLYTIVVVTSDDDMEGPPTAHAQGQILISN